MLPEGLRAVCKNPYRPRFLPTFLAIIIILTMSHTKQQNEYVLIERQKDSDYANVNKLW